MLRVDSEGLTEVAAQLQRALTEIGSELDTLETRSRSLSARWSGQAREAYLDSYVAWRQQFAQLNALLSEIIEAIGSAHSRYTHTERAVKELWLL